jgi:hypothetical protein
MRNKYFSKNVLKWREKFAYLSVSGQYLLWLSASVYIAGEVKEKYGEGLYGLSAGVIFMTLLFKTFLIHVSYLIVCKCVISFYLSTNFGEAIVSLIGIKNIKLFCYLIG